VKERRSSSPSQEVPTPTGTDLDIIEILLVEDNPGDLRLAQEVLRQSKMNGHLSVARDGEEALEFMRRQGVHAEAPRPRLVLLDLNLPKRNGFEVLEELKADRDLQRIPVVVLSSSDSDEDVARAYDLHAACYISKPADFHQFAAVVEQVHDFWLRVARLPAR
jgi:chemotaxis family two-component system response regulator Rcp1